MAYTKKIHTHIYRNFTYYIKLIKIILSRLEKFTRLKWNNIQLILYYLSKKMVPLLIFWFHIILIFCKLNIYIYSRHTRKLIIYIYMCIYVSSRVFCMLVFCDLSFTIILILNNHMTHCSKILFFYLVLTKIVQTSIKSYILKET